MSTFKRVTPDFAVAAHLSLADIAEAAKQGFTRIVNNRPDGEAPDLPASAEMEAAAKAAGLTYTALPFVGPLPPSVVDGTEAWLAESNGPVLAFCRSGTRSITAWAFASVRSGRLSPDEVIRLAGEAGYDLAAHRPALGALKR